ncbi:MAG: ABC transporter permease [Oscillospiraceae bacterium]|nr:ABC transporter permease [Oscillospiraceae bacterium]
MKNKKKILLYAVNALLLILIGVCLLRASYYSNLLVSQQASKYWAGDSDERFAQISCFFPVNNLVSIDTIYTFRKTIDSKLVEGGIEPKEEGENWTDCYSAIDTLTVSGDRTSSETTLVGVGGDFFLFHPYQLVSGSYISDDDLMKDRVVLDYELAWKLFGGTSLQGMTVTINGNPYYVAGVVHREADKLSTKAFTGEPAMFMSYSTLSALNEKTAISCYELAMPDPISKFAKTFAQESFKTQKGVVVENSTRYSFSSIYSIFSHFGDRSMVTSGAIYPYWENAARISEVHIARLYVFILLLALFPFVCLVVLTVKFIKFLKVKIKRAAFLIWDAWDDRYARQAVRKEQKKHKRRAKNLKEHNEKPKLIKKAPKKEPENQNTQNEKETELDIESIVREIMDEMKSSEAQP